MKRFFEEYGNLTLIVIIIILIISLVSPVGSKVKTSVTGLITKFANTTSNVADVMGDDIANLNDNLSGGSGGGSGGDTGGGEAYLSLTDKYVGYYADVNGDNEIDGVIFFDYAHGATTDTGYLGAGVAVTAKTTGLANYTMAEIDGKNVVQKATSGNDRFYVIALENTLPTTPVWSEYALWYNSAHTNISDWDTVTSTAFGTGKTNTATMLAKWNAEAYGAKDNGDMWSNIPNGWFVPSNDEWSVLGSELYKVSTGTFDLDSFVLPIITNSDATLSFNGYYWSSSLINSYGAWETDFCSNGLVSDAVNNAMYVRVATTY